MDGYDDGDGDVEDDAEDGYLVEDEEERSS